MLSISFNGTIEENPPPLTATNWFEGCCWDFSRNFKIPPSPPINAFNGTTQETAPYLGRPPLPIGLKDAAAISQETLKSPPPRQSTLSMELLKKKTPAWGRPPLPIGLKDAAEISQETLKSPPLPANQCFQWNYSRNRPLFKGRPPLPIGLKDAAAISQETLKSPPPRQSMLSMELLKKPPPIWEDHRYELVWRMLLRFLKKL